jgi:hypothetical protein
MQKCACPKTEIYDITGKRVESLMLLPARRRNNS